MRRRPTLLLCLPFALTFGDAPARVTEGAYAARATPHVHTPSPTEHTFDPQGRLAATVLWVVDALGRVEAVSGFDTAAATRLRYDNNGNLSDHHAPLHGRPTRSEYDALDRLSRSIHPLLGEIAFGYDAQNNLRSVSDPRQLVTRYDYNGFDELVRLDSPDSGRTDYSFDAAGNLTQRTDARDIAASYRYDAGNRLVELSYPDETEPPREFRRLVGVSHAAMASSRCC